MVRFLANELGEDGEPLRGFYVSLFDGSSFPSLPWGDEVFDCVVVSTGQVPRGTAAVLSDLLVKQNLDWVQTTGPDAELLHDMVDEAAVGDGRQPEVGHGDPMTSWHTDACSVEQIAEVTSYCFGAADQVLCLVVGSARDLEAFSDSLAGRLSSAA